MISVPSDFKTAAEKNIRDIAAKIKIGSVEYINEDILSVEISREDSDGSGFSIGAAVSDRMTASFRGNTPPSLSNYAVDSYIKIGGSDFQQLGHFFIIDLTQDNGIVTIEAQDKMYYLDKPCKFTGSKSGTVPELSFPATHQQMIDYIAKINGFTHNILCEDFSVDKRPVYDSEAVDDSSKYYTYREILSFIAASHGCNVHFDNTGVLVFTSISGVAAAEIDYTQCSDCSIGDADDGFEIKGVRVICGADTFFINDTGDTYEEDMEGIVEVNNPFCTIEILEYLWHKLGGFRYYSANLTRKGTGWLFPGDTINVTYRGRKCRAIIHELTYSIGVDNGFNETIISNAESAAESGNRIGGESPVSQSKNAMAVYYSVSSAATIPAVGTRAIVLRVNFAADMVCVPILIATIPFKLTTAGTVVFTVIFNGTAIASFPQICAVGDNFKSITMPIVGTTNGQHNVSIYISTSDTAEGTVLANQGYAVVTGNGLAGNVAWDGTISVRELMPYWSAAFAAAMTDISDSVISELQYPIAQTIREQLPIWQGIDIQARHTDISESLPIRAVYAQMGDNEITITFSNPVCSDDMTYNLNAFVVNATVENEVIYLNPTEITRSNQHTISLVFAEISTIGNVVNISYEQSNGNLKDHNGLFVESFVLSFEVTAEN